MLVQTDINELGDKRLDPKESIHREQEALLKQVANRKIDGQEELEDSARSSGARLAWQEIVRRLRLCNANMHFADAQGGGHIAVYRPKDRRELAETVWDAEKFDWWNDHVYVAGFPKQELSEYSHVILDTSNLPIREVRGWRSVLMALIKARAITYQSAVKHFGEPTDQRSGRWHEQLRQYKPL